MLILLIFPLIAASCGFEPSPGTPAEAAPSSYIDLYDVPDQGSQPHVPLVPEASADGGAAPPPVVRVQAKQQQIDQKMGRLEEQLDRLIEERAVRRQLRAPAAASK